MLNCSMMTLILISDKCPDVKVWEVILAKTFCKQAEELSKDSLPVKLKRDLTSDGLFY